MAIYMSMIESSIPNSTYDVYANMKVGSNGDTNGDPTTTIGDVYGDENWGFDGWDGDLTGGFDTGDVIVDYDAKSDGTETLNVGGNEPLTYQTDSIGSIGSVELEAAVQIAGEASWSNVTVDFYRNGSMVESVSPFSAPDVSNIGGSATIKDQTMTVTPSASNDDEVIVLGTMRLHSPGISYPGSTSMFCNVYVTGS